MVTKKVNKKKLVKPKARQSEPYYVYREVIEYINEVNNVDVENYIFGNDKGFKCFWHWIMDGYQINNGGYFTLDLTEDYAVDCPEWVASILGMIAKEFDTDELYIYASW